MRYTLLVLKEGRREEEKKEGREKRKTDIRILLEKKEGRETKKG